MIGTALIYGIDVEVQITDLDAMPDLKFLRDAIDGGYIELVPYFNTIADELGVIQPCVVFCDEDGKRKNLPLNSEATKLWDLALRRLTDKDGNPLTPSGLINPDGSTADVLVGPVIVLTGDAEFMDSM